jgi:tetratricopeptide (TPR) repeat protein
MAREKTDEGLEYLERAFEISPENKGLKFSLAKTYYDIADYKKAKQLLLDIINDKNLEDLLLIRNSYILMSQILYSEGKSKDAIEYIKNAIEIDDKSADAYYIGALIYFDKLKNFENAELFASKFLNIAPSDPRVDKMNEILKVCGNLK